MDDPREFDLFGNPADPHKGGRGRPRKMLTAHDLDRLEAALARGWSNARIAKTLDIGLSTLKRNFGPLLRMRDSIPDRVQLTLFAVTMRKAVEKGDMGAVRQLRQMIAEDDLRFAEARVADQNAEQQQKPKKLGKNEANEIAAEAAENSILAEIEAEAKSGRLN